MLSESEGPSGVPNAPILIVDSDLAVLQAQARGPLKDLREKVGQAKARWRVSKDELDAMVSGGLRAMSHADGHLYRKYAYQKCAADYAVYQDEAVRYRSELAKHWAGPVGVDAED